jgi:hypothetical protein
MGLDLLEFTLALEATCGIAIPDADAERLKTPDDVVNYLQARLPRADTATCLSRRAFYTVRAATAQVTGHPREALTPSTPWSAVLPAEQPNRTWELIGKTGRLGAWPGRPWWKRHSPATGTLGATAAALAQDPAAGLRRPGEGWTRTEIQTHVRLLMAEELGISEFEWHHEFVRDLGCG